jgi:hypothetical protein
MQQKHKTYFALTTVFFVSLFVLLFLLWLPLDDISKRIASMPVASALIAALYQILRDQAAFEKQLLFQQKEHIFGLGVTSHMANVVFDKHVSFCEEYMAELQRTLDRLVAEGPTPKVKENAFNLFTIRQKYSAWITEVVSKSLESFEGTLRDVGEKAREIDRAPDGSQQLTQTLKEADEIWMGLLSPLFNMNIPKDGKIANVESIKAKLREILGIEKLMQIRQWIIDQAIKSVR